MAFTGRKAERVPGAGGAADVAHAGPTAAPEAPTGKPKRNTPAKAGAGKGAG